MKAVSNPSQPVSGRAFIAASGLRAAFLMLLVFILDYAIDFGTSPWLLCLSAAAGVATASALAPTRLRFMGFATMMALLYLFYQLAFWILALNPPSAGAVFESYSLSQHIQLAIFSFLLTAFSTWWFWRQDHAITLEVMLLGGFFIYILSGHRNYRFDLVKLVNSLSWGLGISQLAMLVILGAGVCLWILAYLLSSTLSQRPLSSRHGPKQLVHRSPTDPIRAIVMAALAAALLCLISLKTYEIHLGTSAALIRNGVGDRHEEGLSPLTFQSALGSSNQPAALVRLEGDYRENPFAPMLYLREAALSEYNGRELVAAEIKYDQDVSRTTPAQTYSAETDGQLLFRTPVTQSVYLLTNHNLAFGLDYPVIITRLQPPPGSSRFKDAFRVYSMAPAFSLDEIKTLPVGDPRWSESELAHYLSGSDDPRYAELAKKITAAATSPVEKAFAIASYLSKNAIYTLTPQHQLHAGDDPVAPFLFGDMRGYCVHFSHAIVLLLRALGIPARIGTGYLTDLSQSRDGHILLRMSDRHAWAEVYVASRGWIPFDVKPDKVESHAETPVDMKLLEELMGMIGPSEEILPENAAQDEPNLAEPESWTMPQPRDFAAPILVIILILAGIKLFLLHGWRLPARPRTRLKRLHGSTAAQLYDLGIRRDYGETRLEFQRRTKARLHADLLCSTEILNRANYGRADVSRLNHQTVKEAASQIRREWSALPWSKRMLSWLNPSSIFTGIGGWRW